MEILESIDNRLGKLIEILTTPEAPVREPMTGSGRIAWSRIEVALEKLKEYEQIVNDGRLLPFATVIEELRDILTKYRE